MQRDRGGICGEVCCMHYVVRKFSICMDFPERQGRDTWRGMMHACMHYVVRKFSICKDFLERQGRDMWRGMMHACTML